jgi:hypothetical protein
MELSMKQKNADTLNLEDLRAQWREAWQIKPHNRIGRKMLERSLHFKRHEQQLPLQTQKRLNKLIQNYKRNTQYFEQGHMRLKPGMKIVREWKGKPYVVTVTAEGLKYQNKDYTSLSKIASDITGSKWNGWVFFNLKNNKAAS